MKHKAIFSVIIVYLIFLAVGVMAFSWPQFHGDAQHTGRTSSECDCETPEIIWTYPTSAAVQSSPIIEDDRIYFGSFNDSIYCVDRATGALIWVFGADGRIRRAGALTRDSIVVFASDDSTVYGLHKETGALLWSATTVSACMGAVTWDSSTDNVFLTSYYDSGWHGWLYAYNSDGTFLWNQDPPGGGTWMVISPAIDQYGHLITADFHNPTANVTAYDSATGAVEWNINPTTPGGENDIHSSPAIDITRNRIYYGEDSGNERIMAIDYTPSSASVAWTYLTGDRIHSSPSITEDGAVIIGSSDNQLYAMNPDGTIRWTFPTGGSVSSSALIDANGAIYFGSNDNNLYCLEPSGTERWRVNLGGAVLSSPAMDEDGIIYVGCNDGNLYAIRCEYPLPELDSVWFWEETDCNDSNIVYFCYDLFEDSANVIFQMTADSGATWTPAGMDWFVSLGDTLGDFGDGVAPGNHCFQWDMSADMPGVEQDNFEAMVISQREFKGHTFFLEDWNDGGIADDGWVTGGYWDCGRPWDSTLVSSCCDGTPAVYISRTVSGGSWSGYAYLGKTFSPTVADVDSLLFDFCYGYFAGSDSNCFDIFMPSVRLMFEDGKQVEYRMRGYRVDTDPASPTYLEYLPYTVDTTDTLLPIDISGSADFDEDECYRIARCVRDDAGWFITAPLKEIRLYSYCGRREVGPGLCSASCYVEFDNIRMTKLPSEIVDTVRFIGPLDSSPPLVDLTCSAETLSCRDTSVFSWIIDDMFPTSASPCSLFIDFCEGIDTFITYDDSVLWEVPPINCDSANAIIAVADSFCNWGYDTIEFVLVCDTISPVAEIVNPFDGAFSACHDEFIAMTITDNEAVDTTTIRLVVEGGTFAIADPELIFENDTLYYYPDPAFFDGQTVDVCLVAATDIFENVLEDSVCWSFTMDLTPPLSELIIPVQGYMTREATHQIEIDIADIECGIAAESLVLVVYGETFSYSSGGFHWTPDNIHEGTINFDPAENGISFQRGDTVFIELTACDRPDLCASNCSIGRWWFVIEPDVSCAVFPNPFTPNADGTNDFAAIKYPYLYSEPATVYFFDLRSVLIREMQIAPPEFFEFERLPTWDGRDDHGELVEQGLYIYMIKQAGRIICSGTVLLLR